MRLNETGGLDLETASATHTAVLFIVDNVVPLCGDAFTAMLLQLVFFFRNSCTLTLGIAAE
jgi:hypothetical protein